MFSCFHAFGEYTRCPDAPPVHVLHHLASTQSWLDVLGDFQDAGENRLSFTAAKTSWKPKKKKPDKKARSLTTWQSSVPSCENAPRWSVFHFWRRANAHVWHPSIYNNMYIVTLHELNMCILNTFTMHQTTLVISTSNVGSPHAHNMTKLYRD